MDLPLLNQDLKQWRLLLNSPSSIESVKTDVKTFIQKREERLNKMKKYIESDRKCSFET